MRNILLSRKKKIYKSKMKYLAVTLLLLCLIQLAYGTSIAPCRSCGTACCGRSYGKCAYQPWECLDASTSTCAPTVYYGESRTCTGTWDGELVSGVCDGAGSCKIDPCDYNPCNIDGICTTGTCIRLSSSSYDCDVTRTTDGSQCTTDGGSAGFCNFAGQCSVNIIDADGFCTWFDN